LAGAWAGHLTSYRERALARSLGKFEGGCDPAVVPVHPFTTSPPSCTTSRWRLDLVGSRSASRRTTPGDLVARSSWLVARASRRARPMTRGACDRRLPIHAFTDGHPRIVLFPNSRPRRPTGRQADRARRSRAIGASRRRSRFGDPRVSLARALSSREGHDAARLWWPRHQPAPRRKRADRVGERSRAS
jgi:hypothetical protein